MTARTQAWREQPPSTPVVAAGSTGSIPATAELLAVVAGLPAGAVVLPGLDLTMDAPSWDSLEPTHPQFGMRRLLNTLNLTRADVTPWPVPHQPDAAVETGREARVRLLAEAMRPAATTDGWRDLPPLPAEALAGVTRVTCPGPREEAEAVALMMRETLETPGRTAALVTPDRDLARRVAALLDRWGLTVDDSAGQPLAVTPPGALLRLLAEAAAEDLAPAALLDLLRHPLVAAGYDTGRFHEVVRRLDREVLRGPRAAGGWDGLRAAVSERARSPRRPLLDLLDRLERLLGPLAAMMRGPALPPRALVDLHMRCAEALSASDETPGPLRLWAGPAGEAAAAFAADLLAACDGLPPMAPKDYPGVLDALMVGQPVRRPFGTASIRAWPSWARWKPGCMLRPALPGRAERGHLAARGAGRPLDVPPHARATSACRRRSAGSGCRPTTSPRRWPRRTSCSAGRARSRARRPCRRAGCCGWKPCSPAPGSTCPRRRCRCPGRDGSAARRRAPDRPAGPAAAGRGAAEAPVGNPMSASCSPIPTRSTPARSSAWRSSTGSSRRRARPIGAR